MNLVYKIYFAAQTTVQQDINSLNTDTLPKNNLGNSDLQNVLSIVFGVAAAIAVLMIVIAGFRFIVGEGNPEETSKAKSTILYAIIGLFVSLSAEAIVAFVLKA
jgi:type IV secretory pathway VirB2 component (pilin)